MDDIDHVGMFVDRYQLTTKTFHSTLDVRKNVINVKFQCM